MARRLTLREKVLRLVTEKHTPAEIEAAGKALYAVLNSRHDRARVEGMLQFDAGDFVINTNGSRRLPKGVEGTVVRRLQKNVLVDFGRYGKWRCPATHIKKGGKGTKLVILKGGKNTSEMSDSEFNAHLARQLG